MTLRRRLGLRLARLSFVAHAVVDDADLSAFAGRPSVSLIVGVFLIGLSFIIGGWPTLAVIGGVAIYLREPLVAVIGGPLAYGLSWLVWALGMLIAGKESVHYGRHFGRWAARKGVERLLGPREANDAVARFFPDMRPQPSGETSPIELVDGSE